MEELENKIQQLLGEVKAEMDRLNVAGDQQKLKDLQAEMAKGDFWQDRDRAAKTSKQAGELERKVSVWQSMASALDDLASLVQSGDQNLASEIKDEYDKIFQTFQAAKAEQRFNGPYDDRDVILNIYAGAGGTDAQDWAQMLVRMYTRWAEAHDGKLQLLDQSAGEEAGIKSATLKITGIDHLYGKLAGEHGVHRLVRKSPFNSAGSRETSFARVDVLPVIDEPKELELDDKDLKIDVFRSGGAGGQSVNTTDSAVRVTHLPTGITVSIQNERSQLQNKETALNILRSRLIQLQLEQHAQTLGEIKGPTQAAEWGSQIRNYILDDRIVKDLRSGWQSHDPQKVLDGDLDPLIAAQLES